MQDVWQRWQHWEREFGVNACGLRPLCPCFLDYSSQGDITRHNMAYYKPTWPHNFTHMLCGQAQRKTSKGLKIRVIRREKGLFLVFST
jgi:hypothetical protein